MDGPGKVSIATTRPELLSACVAVTVHPDDERYQDMAGKYLEVPIYNRKVKLITDSDVLSGVWNWSSNDLYFW